ncbi:hypothetical protein P3S23_23210, partial [Enterobacter hormaechei]|nr:hypothetical protein [Enterobacter hormaechei]
MTRLRGFSPQFDSIQQFILTLTHVVWEQKDIGQLADFYATPVVFTTPEKQLHELSQFMRLTLEAMHSFPQRAVLTEDILCSQNPGDEYYAAQRTVARIQHQGEGFLARRPGKMSGSAPGPIASVLMGPYARSGCFRIVLRLWRNWGWISANLPLTWRPCASSLAWRR